MLGKAIPLPAGRWRVLAHAQPNPAQDEMVVLGKIEKRALEKLVAIRVAISPTSLPLSHQPCDRHHVFTQKLVANAIDGSQICWWNNHASSAWNQPVFNSAATQLAQLAVPAPNTLINAAFQKTDNKASVNVFYYTNPEISGMTTPPSDWQSSEWHKDRVGQDPKKMKYLQDRESWAESWLPLIRAAK